MPGLAVEQQQRQPRRERRQHRHEQHGVGADRPDEERHPRPGHALGPHVRDRDDEVDRACERRERQHVQREDPEVLAVPDRPRGERRVGRPARPGGAALGEEREQQDDAAEDEEPVGEGVQAREGHVAGADHQRHEVVREPGEDRDDDEEDHRRAVHRQDLVVGVPGQEVVARLRELRPHQHRHHAAGEEEDPGGDDVEDPDPLVVHGDEPARDAAALPGGDRRLGVSRQGAPPAGTR